MMNKKRLLLGIVSAIAFTALYGPSVKAAETFGIFHCNAFSGFGTLCARHNVAGFLVLSREECASEIRKLNNGNESGWYTCKPI